MWRLAQDARIITLGEYETRKGFDFHSDAVGETLDQSQTSTTGAADQSFSETTWLAQPMTTGSAGQLSKIEVRLKNDAAASGTILIEFYTNNGGVPGTFISRTSIDASELASSYAYEVSRFVNAPTLASATQYWIVARVQSVGSGSYKWSSTTTATTALVSTNSGTSWSSTSFALNFRQYYATAAPVKGLHRAYKSDGTTCTLFASGTTLYVVNEVSGALSVIKSGLSASATNYRFVTINDIVYYINEYDGLRKWDFTTESQVNSTNYSLISEHKGMLFLVEKNDPNKLVFSNFAVYETFTSTDFIYVPSPKTGDPVTALKSLNGYMLIFTRDNKFILSGEDNATFRLDEAPDQKGTFSQETVAADDNFVYYLSDDGVYRSNGTEPQSLSEHIFEQVRTLANKNTSCLCVSKGRLYFWFRSQAATYNDQCYVWNLNYGSGGTDCVESLDMNANVTRAVNAFRDNDELLVGSSVIGQVYWQELASNNYHNLGGDLEYTLQTHYMAFDTPAVLKEIRYWEPRFAAQSSSYDISCEYAYDLRDNWQLYSSPDVQGAGVTYGSGALYGDGEIYGTTSETQAYLYVPGEYRRIALRYTHTAARQPHTFLGHSLVVQQRRMR
jgi:hypothetical protein